MFAREFDSKNRISRAMTGFIVRTAGALTAPYAAPIVSEPAG